MTDGGMAVTGTHDVRLVVLSVVIAVIASYTALDLAGRVTVAQGRARKLWLVGGAIAMGVGIWSMHFVAMLAYHLLMPVAYDVPIVLISMAVAVVASGVALFIVSRQKMGWLEFLTGGIFMGVGIAAMHYTGMAAMQLEATTQYNPTPVALSIIIAIAASLIALRLAFDLRTETMAIGNVRKIGSAIVMGNAIAGMHYIAMAAVSFKPTNQLEAQSSYAIDNPLLAIGISIATLVILALALLASLFDRRISIETARAETVRQSEERFRSFVQNSSDIIAVVSADGTVDYQCLSIKQILGYEPKNWRKAFEFVHPDDLAKAENLLTRALGCAGANFADELRLQHANGSWRNFEVIVNNLLNEIAVAGVVTTYRDITARKQAEAVLQQQTEWERLVAGIAQRIRQSLNLREILSVTVSEVRQFLQAERVLIYRFEPDWSGVVAVESVDSGWPSIMGTRIKDTFFEASSNRELYKQGRIQAIEDIYTGETSQCHIDLLAQLQVRANLVVPIVQSSSVSGLSLEPIMQNSNLKTQDSKLWGLLIANHCSEPRQWQELEISLLKQLATQVAIAIQQSTLFEQAQTELTERKQAEAALRESEEKFRNLVEQTNDWIWKIDRNGVFTYVSPQVRQIVGYEPAEILGKTIFDLMATDEVKRFAEVLEFFVSVQKPFTHLEKMLIHKDGHLVVLEASGSPMFDSQGIFQGYRGIARDITERKRAEQAINNLNEDLQRRANELEAANRELEAFSYSVSHDLRAPLRAMNGFSGILISEYAPQFPPEAKRYLQMVRDNAQQMGQLVDDLLKFSRLGRSSLRKQPVASVDLVRQAIANLYPEQQDRQIEVSINDLPACQADPALLKQVWINLLANALKFTRRQQVAHIEVGCQQINSEPVYFIEDNGVGFDMDYTDKLFGVFQRLHRAEEYEGTGVGLAIVQRIIHRHGGRIWAEAEVNKGAVFYFTLGEDNHHDRDCSRNSVSGRQSERRGINPPLLEKQ
jgi:PAS domain S-box-containing protein